MKAQMRNYNEWVENTDPVALKKHYDKLLVLAGFKILNFTEHTFEPQGWTALWLLGESHFAVHTFPEENKTYIELSSCVDKPYEDFVKMIKCY